MTAGEPADPAPADPTDAGLDDFVRHRDLLFTIAYEITGSVADAEDVVQESYLRWQEAMAGKAGATEIRHPRA